MNNINLVFDPNSNRDMTYNITKNTKISKKTHGTHAQQKSSWIMDKFYGFMNLTVSPIMYVSMNIST